MKRARYTCTFPGFPRLATPLEQLQVLTLFLALYRARNCFSVLLSHRPQTLLLFNVLIKHQFEKVIGQPGHDHPHRVALDKHTVFLNVPKLLVDKSVCSCPSCDAAGVGGLTLAGLSPPHSHRA